MDIDIIVTDDQHGKSTTRFSLTMDQRRAVIENAHNMTKQFADALGIRVRDDLIPALEREFPVTPAGGDGD